MSKPTSVTLCTFDALHAHELRELPISVGWVDSIADWNTILTCGRVIGHRDETGAVVSTGALFDFGSVYTIGKMIVRASHQGQGLAREILERLLSMRRPNVHTSLVATEMGRPVYEKFGFSVIGDVHKLTIDAPNATERALRARTVEASFEDLLACDQRVFGADRRRMLAARVRQSEACLAQGGAFGLRVPGTLSVLGPVLAQDTPAAHAMIMNLVRCAKGPCRIDVNHTKRDLIAALRAAGFSEIKTHPVMSLGGTHPPGQREGLYALAAQAWG
ncbi:MAG: GNAT family N-acetyltransferase [Sandaracinaceae bacterium]|jgi:GNAT superfamily N-acetyltransferase|nr:GNAT family N-acetyltransferase [Sandaracinaceae bacterium]